MRNTVGAICRSAAGGRLQYSVARPDRRPTHELANRKWDIPDDEWAASVKARRKALKLTQTELAKLVGISPNRYQRYEKADERVSPQMRARIEAALKGWIA